jgi:hypothetical protein
MREQKFLISGVGWLSATVVLYADYYSSSKFEIILFSVLFSSYYYYTKNK